MADAKYARLITLIADANERGDIKWEKTADDSRFAASFGEYSLQITSERSRDPDAFDEDIVITIIDGNGETVEEMRDIDFRLEDLGGKNPYALMQEVLRTARRQAMGVEKALDFLIDKLKPSKTG
jgi:hypothetical protein